MQRKTVLVSLGLFLGTAACGPPVEPGGTPGALKSGGFVYCRSAGSCDYRAKMPAQLAVGATFGLEFDGEYSGSVRLSSPNGALESVANEDPVWVFRGTRPGHATVEARDEADDTLVDYVDLELAALSRIEPRECDRAFNALHDSTDTFDPTTCRSSGAVSALTLSRGAELAPTLCVFPVDGSGHDLGGTLDTPQWTVGPPAELELHVAADGLCATIGGLTLGTASVTITSQGQQAALDVTVAP